MSHLKYYAYKDLGVKQQKDFHYSQAVRVGDRIECAGQGKKDRPQHRVSIEDCALIYG